jgi:hypothetical protein
MSAQAGAWVDAAPNLEPADDYQGLKSGDRIDVLWTEDAAPVPATVLETVVFGARVEVDPTADPGWSCGPFEMYVTQQTPAGSWAR